MAAEEKSAVSLHKMSEGASLFSSPQGTILFGCPPEILKRILASHLPMPDTVVVGEKLHHIHSSQASLEFPLYHFLFVQRGLERKRQFQVVANAAQCKGLEELLRITVVGPTEKEMISAGTEPSLAKSIHQEINYLRLKYPKSGAPVPLKKMVRFLPLEIGKRRLVYPGDAKKPAVSLERNGPELFRVLYGEDVYSIDISVHAEQIPVYRIRQKTMNRSKQQFRLTVLGRSNGFDPNDPANGYLLNMDGRLVLWDCPAYLHQQLRKLKVDPNEIEALILSHVHEDHIDTSESLRDNPFDLYATPEVYYSLLVKLSAVFGCSLEEARRYHNWKRIDVGRPLSLCGATFQFFHSVHAIPAIGARITRVIDGKKRTVHISGDHLSKVALEDMKKNNGISQQRYDFISNILDGTETLILMDVGGGNIHGDYRDYLDHKGPVAYMHTGLIQEELPEDKHLVTSGEVLDILNP